MQLTTMAWSRWSLSVISSITLLLTTLPTLESKISGGIGGIGEMTPSDPLITTGDELVLNCTLNTTHYGNSSGIYFQFGDRRIDEVDGLVFSMEALDEFTMQLRWQNMTRKYSNKHFFCYLTNSDDPSKPYRVAQQVVVVADLPIKPNITGCRVYNWERMVCTWEPKVQDTGLLTTQQLYYTLLPLGQKQFNNCTKQVNYTCDIAANHPAVITAHFIHLRVYASNKIKNVSSDTKTVFPTKIVEPDQVEHLRTENVTSRSATIAWGSPYPVKKLRYEINVTLMQEDGSLDHSNTKSYIKNSEGVASDKNSIFKYMDHLKPFRCYNVTVRCIPLTKFTNRTSGFWSQPASTTFQLLAEVPAANPEVVPGGFYSADRDPTYRDVTIFWKKTPFELRNGEITRYLVEYKNIRTDEKHEERSPGSEFSNEWTLRKDESYIVYIRSENAIGFNTSLNASVLHIPAETTMPPSPANFSAVAVNDSVLLNWDAVDGALSYTVFWCRGLVSRAQCNHDDHLDWATLPTNTTTFYYLLPNNTEHHENQYAEFIFGISVLASGGHSGGERKKRSSPATISSALKWVNCVSSITDALAVPPNFRASKFQDSGSLAVEWDELHCAHTGYIKYFIITYCRKKDCAATMTNITIPGDADRYIIKKLDADEEYVVKMMSWNPWTNSDYTEPITHQVSGMTGGEIAGILIGALIALLLILVGIWAIYQKVRKTAHQKLDIHVDLPDTGNFLPQDSRYEEEHGEPRYTEYMHGRTPQGTELTQPLVDSSGPTRVWENVENQNREQFEGVSHGYHAVPDREGHIYMNGDIRSHGLVVQCKFPNRDSGTGSVSSNDTVTTPLPSDNSMDTDDVFANRSLGKGTNGLNKALMPVPEESSGGVTVPASEGPSPEYYNIDDDEEDDVISSYNALGMADDSLDKECFMRALQPVENSTYHTLNEGAASLPPSWRGMGAGKPSGYTGEPADNRDISVNSSLDFYTGMDENLPIRVEVPHTDYISSSLPMLDRVGSGEGRGSPQPASSTHSSGGQDKAARSGPDSGPEASSLPSLQVMSQLLRQNSPSPPPSPPPSSSPTAYVAHNAVPLTSSPVQSPSSYVPHPPPVAKDRPPPAKKVPEPHQSFAHPSGMSGGTMIVAPNSAKVSPIRPVAQSTPHNVPSVPSGSSPRPQSAPTASGGYVPVSHMTGSRTGTPSPVPSEQPHVSPTSQPSPSRPPGHTPELSGYTALPDPGGGDNNPGSSPTRGSQPPRTNSTPQRLGEPHRESNPSKRPTSSPSLGANYVAAPLGQPSDQPCASGHRPTTKAAHSNRKSKGQTSPYKCNDAQTDYVEQQGSPVGYVEHTDSPTDYVGHKPVGYVEHNGIAHSPGGYVEHDGPAGYVEHDGPAGYVEHDGPAGYVDHDGPTGYVEHNVPDGSVEHNDSDTYVNHSDPPAPVEHTDKRGSSPPQASPRNAGKHTNSPSGYVEHKDPVCMYGDQIAADTMGNGFPPSAYRRVEELSAPCNMAAVVANNNNDYVKNLPLLTGQYTESKSS